jgi:hypothetical protein
MRNVIFFTLSPWRLRRLEGVGAAFDYSRHLFPEFTLDITQPFRAATIFHCIVQQPRDRFCLIRAVLQYDRGDPEDMPDIGNPCLLPKFAAVNSGGVYQGLFKLRR